jgi:hypothetical protein
MSSESLTGKRAGIPLSAMKEQFSLAFVRLVVSAAGFTILTRETDYDGVDLTIEAPGDHEWAWSPRFDLQVECTSQREVASPDSVRWRMDAGPFRKLIEPRRVIPAFLGVLVVPEDPDAWLKWGEEWVAVNGEMYWARATDLGGIDDGAASTTVHIPTSNLFDVGQLRSIVASLRGGGMA